MYKRIRQDWLAVAVLALAVFIVAATAGLAAYYDVYGTNGLLKGFLQIGTGTPGFTLGAGDLFVSDDLGVGDDASIGGDLTVTGTITATSAAATFTDTTVNNLTVNGDAGVGGDLSVTGSSTAEDYTATGDIVVGGDASIGGDLTVTGAITATSAAATFTDTTVNNLTVNGDVIGDGGGTSYGFLSTVSAAAADYTLTAGDSGKVITNNGASGEVTINLAALAVGGQVMLANTEPGNYTLNANPGDTEQILLATNAAGDQVQSTTTGDTITLVKTSATTWAVLGAYPANTDWADAD